MWHADTIIVASRNQVSCDIGGETAILQLSSGIYYGLNPVGSRIWEWIQKPRTLAELENSLLEEYDVAPDRASSDLRELCERLASACLIDRP